MALQTTGPISISQIKSELGSSSNSLRTLSSAAGFSVPDSMSEFYGFSNASPSLYYWLGDGVNDTMRITGQATFGSTSNDLSWSGWYRIDEASAAVQQLGSISQASQNGTNQIFIQYSGPTLNRLYWRFRHNGSFHQIQVPLHNNNSITGTGTSSTNYWTASNRGNTNADGFVHLTFTYDASDRNANTGMRVYWNAQELTTKVNVQSVGSPAHWNFGSIAVGDLVSSVPNNANVFKGGIDNVSIHSKVLTQSEITALYNSGTPINCADAGVTSNLVAEYLLEQNSNNTSGTYPDLQNLNGGAFPAY